MPARRIALIAVVVVFVLGGAAVALLWKPIDPGPKTPILTIDSQPSGARVRIDGSDVGQTPIYSDNHYRPGPVKVQISLKGYREWAGQFDGGAEAAISATLVKLGPPVSLEKVAIEVKHPEPVDAGDPNWHDPDLDEDPK